MPLRVTNLRLGLDDPDSALPERLAAIFGLPAEQLHWRLLRKSLDTREKSDIHFVVSVEVQTPDDDDALRRVGIRSDVTVEHYADSPYSMPDPGTTPMRHRPVIVGSGPGGLFAGCILAEQGYRPIVLERGPAVSERIRSVKTFDSGGPFDPESNYLFGEGGAGTFSDGKLTSRATGPDVRRVLEMLAENKGTPDILYEHRPHLGSNRLPAVVKALRRRIERLGGEVRFLARVEDLEFSSAGIASVATSGGAIPADVVVLAIGHSARDTYEMLARRGVPLEQKPFQMGVRVEHPQELVNRIRYGRRTLEDSLGNADYSLVARGEHDLFTFCMCAGGYVIPSVSAEGIFCTNGMSLSRRDSIYANSGLVVTVPTSDFGGSDVLAGVRLQEHFERLAFEIGRGEYRCPAQRATDFMSGRESKSLLPCSYPRGVVAADLHAVLPPMVAAAVAAGLPRMDRRWHGKFLPQAMLVGPEARGSSPVRIVRDPESRQSPGIAGLFPVGEGAGYAGGIVSAAVDGLRTARAIISSYAQP